MFGFSVAMVAQTASFREPSAHLYQKSFPLPPLSTLAGIAGAAVGMEFSSAWGWLKKQGAMFGVCGQVRGRGIDLWSYNKIATPKSSEEKNSAKILDITKTHRKDILNREFLADVSLTAYYAFEKERDAAQLQNAFCDPVYALSLGSSDDIAKISAISSLGDVYYEETTMLSNTYIKGNYSQEIGFDWCEVQKSSVSQTLTAPQLCLMVTDFFFSVDGRRPSSYGHFTLISHNHLLRKPVPAYIFGDDERVQLNKIGKIN